MRWILYIVIGIREDAMRALVDSIPMLSDLQREFYKTMLIERKHIILDETYHKIVKKNEELENDCLRYKKSQDKISEKSVRLFCPVFNACF